MPRAHRNTTGRNTPGRRDLHRRDRSRRNGHRRAAADPGEHRHSGTAAIAVAIVLAPPARTTSPDAARHDDSPGPGSAADPADALPAAALASAHVSLVEQMRSLSHHGPAGGPVVRIGPPPIPT